MPPRKRPSEDELLDLLRSDVEFLEKNLSKFEKKSKKQTALAAAASSSSSSLSISDEVLAQLNALGNGKTQNPWAADAGRPPGGEMDAKHSQKGSSSSSSSSSATATAADTGPEASASSASSSESVAVAQELVSRAELATRAAFERKQRIQALELNNRIITASPDEIQRLEKAHEELMKTEEESRKLRRAETEYKNKRRAQTRSSTESKVRAARTEFENAKDKEEAADRFASISVVEARQAAVKEAANIITRYRQPRNVARLIGDSVESIELSKMRGEHMPLKFKPVYVIWCAEMDREHAWDVHHSLHSLCETVAACVFAKQTLIPFAPLAQELINLISARHMDNVEMLRAVFRAQNPGLKVDKQTKQITHRPKSEHDIERTFRTATTKEQLAKRDRVLKEEKRKGTITSANKNAMISAIARIKHLSFEDHQLRCSSYSMSIVRDVLAVLCQQRVIIALPRIHLTKLFGLPAGLKFYEQEFELNYETLPTVVAGLPELGRFSSSSSSAASPRDEHTLRKLAHHAEWAKRSLSPFYEAARGVNSYYTATYTQESKKK